MHSFSLIPKYQIFRVPKGCWDTRTIYWKLGHSEENQYGWELYLWCIIWYRVTVFQKTLCPLNLHCTWTHCYLCTRLHGVTVILTVGRFWSWNPNFRTWTVCDRHVGFRLGWRPGGLLRLQASGTVCCAVGTVPLVRNIILCGWQSKGRI